MSALRPAVVTQVRVTTQSHILRVDPEDEARIDANGGLDYWLRLVVINEKHTAVDLTFHTGKDGGKIILEAIGQLIEELRKLQDDEPEGEAPAVEAEP